jgi:hypothetical protein
MYMKHYQGIVPSCAVFCGGCPRYTQERNACPGASTAGRCDKCKYHLCCIDKGIEHCWACEQYPCKDYKTFAKRWTRYGQDFIENQQLLKQVGQDEFIKIWNEKVENG